jgi:hypothetical protein
MDNLVRRIGTLMNTVLRGQSGMGEPFKDTQPWQLSNMVALATMTAMALLGLNVPFTSEFHLRLRRELRGIGRDSE